MKSVQISPQGSINSSLILVLGMKNLFTPIFVISLFFLFLVDGLGIHAPGVSKIMALAFFAVSLGFYGIKKYRLCYVLAVLGFGLLMVSRFMVEKEMFCESRESIRVPRGQYVTVLGDLAEFPEIKNDHSILLLDARVIKVKKQEIQFRGKIRVKVAGDLRDFYRGDRVEISLRLYFPSFSRNFEPDRGDNYYLVRGIHLTGFCKSKRLVTAVRPGPGHWQILGKWRNCLRQSIENKYMRDKTLSRPGVFLEAILLGDRGRLSNRDKDRLIDAGIFHLLAISGAHIGIIVVICLWVMGRLKLKGKKKYVILMVILVFFLALSGFKVSAERAVWMAFFIFTARVLGVDITIFNLISMCGLFMLIRNPAAFLDAGFILTFTLTAAIVAGRRVFLLFFGRIKNSSMLSVLKRRCGYWILPVFKALRIGGKSESSVAGGVGRNSDGESPGAVWELMSANVSATLISFPLSLYFFRRYTVAGYFSGLLLIPLTGVIIGLGFLLLLFSPLPGGVDRGILFILDIPMAVFFAVADFFSNVVNMRVIGSPPSLIFLSITLSIFFIWAMVRNKEGEADDGKRDEGKAGQANRRWSIVAGILFLISMAVIVLSPFIFYYTTGNLEVFYLDVGQGDSIVVVFPGGDGLLIDGGGSHYSDFPVGRNIVLPFLAGKNIRIKWVAVSHFHPDHANGLADILGVIKPEELWISEEAAESQSYGAVMAALPKGTAIKKLWAGYRKKINGCFLEVLFPKQFICTSRAKNNHSQVIRISDGFHSFLFPGDIEKEVELELAGTCCSDLEATVLKVPHHGSRSSSTLGFLDCVKPDLAIFSYGRHNRFRFPHRAVTENYLSRKIPTLTTARSGGIHIISTESGIKIETSK